MKRTRLLATLIVSIATASVMWSGQMGLSTTQTSAAVNHLQGASFMAVSGAARRESGSRGIFATKNEQAKPGNAPAKRSSSPLEPVNFQLDDNSAEDSIGWNYVNSDRSSAAIWLNRFTPTTPYYPITLENISILWPGSGAGPLLGREIRLLVYVDVDANNDPSNAVLVYQSVQTIQIANWVEWQTYSVNVPISLPGDIYIGFESKYGETAPSPRTYPAALDTTTTQARSWIAAKNTGDVPDINNLGQNDTLDLIDYFGYAGNWMVRASGHDALVFTPTPTVTPTPLPPRCPGERFTDVCPGDYFYTPVLSLNDAGVISGYNTSPPCESSAHIPCFKPFNNTTRGQLSKIVVLANRWSIYTPPTPTFRDVPTNDAFYQYIETAYSHNIISGYSCGTGCLEFHPGSNVTRGQLCKIIALAEGWSLLNPPIPTFSDVPTTHTFYQYIETAYAHNIISGYNCGTGCLEFRPGGSATRGQIAKIVYNAINQPTPTPTSTAIPTGTYTPAVSPTETETSTPTGTVIAEP